MIMKHFKRMTLKQYILIQVLILFVLTALLVSVYSYYRNKNSLGEFSYQYVDKYSHSIIAQVEKRFAQATVASDFMSLYYAGLIDDDKVLPRRDGFPPAAEVPHHQRISPLLPEDGMAGNPYDLISLPKAMPQKKALFNLKDSPLFDSDNREHVFLKQSLDSFGTLSAIYFANANGDFVQVRYIKEYDKPQLKTTQSLPRNASYAIRMLNVNKGVPMERWAYYSKYHRWLLDEYIFPSQYNPLKRPWFTEPTGNAHYVSPVYQFGTINNLVQTTSKRIESKAGELLAVSGIDLDIRELSIFLKKTKISKQAIFYILDQNDEVVASSDPKLPMALTGAQARIAQLKEFETNPLWQALSEFKTHKLNHFSLEHNDKEYVVGINTFSDAFIKKMNGRWKMVLLLPTKELFSVFMDAQDDAIGLYILIFAIIIINIIILSRRISDPIEELTEEANAIRRFDFSRVSEFSSHLSEIIDLNKALVSMKYSLGTFAKYMPKRLVMRLMERGEKVELGGESKDLAIFFSDIVGFSTISEGLTAEQLMQHISEYFNTLTTIIIENNGTVDKYIGDAVMAFWGAPDPDDAKHYNACRSVLAIQHYLKELNNRWAEEGKPPLVTRIGLHSGDVVVGNMGSEDRMNYTIIGDNVNLASRLEGVNTFYGTLSIVSESIHAAVSDKFLMRTLDVVSVKGKKNGVRIYELLGEFDGPEHLRPSPAEQAFVKTFDQAFDFYMHQNFDKASQILAELSKKEDQFPASFALSIKTFKERCIHYKKSPPDDNWNGVHTLTKKK